MVDGENNAATTTQNPENLGGVAMARVRAKKDAQADDTKTGKAKGRGRGRPSKAETDAKLAEERQAAGVELVGILAPVLIAVNEGLSERFPHYRYTEDELQAISEVGARVMAKYSSSMMLQYGDEIALFALVGGGFLGKHLAHKQRGAAEERAALKAETTGSKNGTG
jgi:hypothetical protein